MALLQGKSFDVHATTPDGIVAYYAGHAMYVMGSVDMHFTEYYDIGGNYSQLHLERVSTRYRAGYVWPVDEGDFYVTPNITHFTAGETYVGYSDGSAMRGNYPLVSDKIYHDVDGLKTVELIVGTKEFYSNALGFTCNVSPVTLTVELTPIARVSELAAAAGELGQAQTLTVSRRADVYSHSLQYVCGSVSGALCVDSVAEQVTWTPDMDLARQNTEGDSVTVEYTLTTYNGGAEVGSNVYTVEYAIPDRVRPVVTSGWAVPVPENTGAVEGISCFVQGYSRGMVLFDSSKIDLSTAYGASVVSYKVECGGEVLTESPYKTAVLHTAGAMQVRCSLTDSRGRTVSETVPIVVQPYTKPVLSDISLHRSDSAGNASDTGLYIAVQATAGISALNGENSYALQVRYQTGARSYGVYEDIPSGEKTVIGGGMISVTSSYLVELLLTDRLGNKAVYTQVIPTEAVFFSGSSGGTAAGFGKHPEGEELLDVAWNLRVKQNADVEGTMTVDGDLQVSGGANLGALTVGGKSLLNLLYPVGSVVWRYDHVNPGTLLGGVWERIQGAFPWAAGEEDTIGGTGGARSHALTEAELPAHSHVAAAYAGVTGWSGTSPTAYLTVGENTYTTITAPRTGETGGGQAIDIMPPYVNISAWRRTA